MCVCVFILSLTTMTRCSQMNANMNKDKKKKFEWEATWNAPKLYTMRLIDGSFYSEDRPSTIRHGYGDNGWGFPGSYSIGNTAPKHLPQKLKLHWYSFTEDKFYEGNFTLPYDRILELFNEGFNMRRAKVKCTYEDIVVGIAPGGRVAVWVKGDGKQTEVGIYQAEESEYLNVKYLTDWFYYTLKGEEGMKIYRINILKNDGGEAWKNLEQNGIPFGIWDTYRERYRLRPVMVYEDPNCITDEIYMEFFNGEKKSLSLENLEKNEFQNQARIKYIEAYWSFGQEIRKVKIKFDEKEIFKIYEEIYGENPDAPVEVQLCLNKDNNYFKVYFACTEGDNPRRIQVKHANINWYLEREDNREYFEVFKNSTKQ